MERKTYIVHCPFCNNECKLFFTDEELKDAYLLGEIWKGGMECLECKEKIIFTPLNLYLERPSQK